LRAVVQLCPFVFVWVTIVISQIKKAEAIEQQIGRFERSARRRLRRLASISPRLGDLIISFPAAAYVIATNSVGPDAAGEAVRRVKEGSSLQDVAKPLGIPMWLKRVPPEAFSGSPTAFPDGEKFARRIAGRIPQNPAHAVCWLNWVCFAGQAADEEFALWIAAEKPPFARPLPTDRVPLRPLAIFAWFSLHPRGLAHELMEKPWQPSMRFPKALSAMQAWLDRIARLFKPERPRRGFGRYSRRPSGGLRMVPLRTGPQLREEGRIMNHCVGDYAQQVATGQSLIFSVRDGVDHIATLEIRRQAHRNGYSINQLHGPSNRRPSEGVRIFARNWVDQFSADPTLALQTNSEEFTLKPAQWKELWQPYTAAKGNAGLELNPANLEALFAEADALRLAA
jgi:PcfJ-like protein